MDFVTLNTLRSDLLNMIRSAKVNVSEPISRVQIEAWLHQYRAILLKRDLDKGEKPNPDYVQSITFELEPVDILGSDTILDSGTDVYRTKLQVPNTIDLNFKSGILYVGDTIGNEIQLMPEFRSFIQKDRRYTKNDRTAFLRGGYLWVNNASGLRYIVLRGIFENPIEVYELINALTQQKLATYDLKYPMPMSLVPALKDMIMTRELNIETKMPSDNTNDSNFLVEQNVKT